MAGDVVQKLITELAYKVDDSGIKKYDKQIESAIKSTTKLERAMQKRTKFNFDSSSIHKIEKELSQAKKNIESFDNELKKRRELKVDPEGTNKLNSTIKTTKKNVDDLDDELKKPKKIKIDDDQLDKSRSEIKKTIHESKNLKQTLEHTFKFKVDSSMLKTAGSLAMNLAKNGLMLLGRGAINAGQAVVDVGLDALDAASQYEKAMSIMQGATNFNTKEMEMLDKASLQAGKDTQFSAIDAIDAVKQLGKELGGAKAASIALLPALEFTGGASGLISVAEGAKITTATLNAFGRDATKARETVDSLTRSTQLGSIGYRDLDGIIAKGASTATATSQSLGTFLALVNGIKSQGGTARASVEGLVSMMRRLNTASPKKNGPVEKGLKALGLSIDDIRDKAGKMKNFPDVLDLIESRMKKVKGATDAQTTGLKNAIKSQLFAEKGFTTYDKVMKAGTDTIRKNAQSIDHANLVLDKNGKIVGASAAANQAFMATWEGIKELISGTVDTIKIQLGRKFLPAVKEAGERFLNDFLNPLLDGVNDMKVMEKNFPLLAKIIKTMGKTFEEVKPELRTFFKEMSDRIPDIMKSADKLSNLFIKSFAKMTSVTLKIIPKLVDVANGIINITDSLNNIGLNPLENLLELLDRLIHFKDDYKHGLNEMLDFDGDAMGKKLGEMAGKRDKGRLGGDSADASKHKGEIRPPEGAWEEFKEGMNKAFEQSNQNIEEFKNTWLEGFDTISERREEFWDTWLEGFEKLKEGGSQWAEDFNSNIDKISENRDQFWDDWLSGYNTLKEQGQSWIDYITEGVSNFINNAIAKGKEFVENWKSGYNAIKEEGQRIWEGIKEKIAEFVEQAQTKANEFKEAFINAGNNIKSAVSGALSSIKSILDGIVEKIQSALASMKTLLSTAKEVTTASNFANQKANEVINKQQQINKPHAALNTPSSFFTIGSLNMQTSVEATTGASPSQIAQQTSTQTFNVIENGFSSFVRDNINNNAALAGFG